jgi:hypothetical protein
MPVLIAMPDIAELDFGRLGHALQSALAKKFGCR